MDLVLKLTSDLFAKLVEMEERHRRLLKNCPRKVNVSLLLHELKTARVRDRKHWVG